MTYRKAPWDALKFQADIISRFGFLLHSSEWHKWRNYKQWLYFKNFLWWNWYWLWYWLQRLSRNSYNGAQWILTSRKLPPMKIPSYESSPLWKLPSRKLSPMKTASTAVRNWKLLPCSPYVVMKNKAWWGVWWSWVSWKYRYLLNFTWIVVFF